MNTQPADRRADFVEGSAYLLEFLGSETIELARLIGASEQPLGPGFTFQKSIGGQRIFVYAKDIQRGRGRNVIVMDGR